MSSIDILAQRDNGGGRLVWARLPAVDPDTGKPTRAPRDARYRVRYRTPHGQSRTKTFDRRVDAERFMRTVDHPKDTGEFVDPMAGRVTLRRLRRLMARAQSVDVQAVNARNVESPPEPAPAPPVRRPRASGDHTRAGEGIRRHLAAGCRSDDGAGDHGHAGGDPARSGRRRADPAQRGRANQGRHHDGAERRPDARRQRRRQSDGHRRGHAAEMARRHAADGIDRAAPRRVPRAHRRPRRLPAPHRPRRSPAHQGRRRIRLRHDQDPRRGAHDPGAAGGDRHARRPPGHLRRRPRRADLHVGGRAAGQPHAVERPTTERRAESPAWSGAPAPTTCATSLPVR